MEIVYVLIGSGVLVLTFLILWLKERKNAQREYIAYGLRSTEDNTENTRTNVTLMDAGYREAMTRLEDMGEVSQDQWGQWIWNKTGKPVGKSLSEE